MNLTLIRINILEIRSPGGILSDHINEISIAGAL